MRTATDRLAEAKARHATAISRRDQIAQKIRKLQREREIQEKVITARWAAVQAVEVELRG